MKLNEIEKGTLIEISYALGKENIVIKKETKNNNISKKVLKNSSLHNKKLPSVVIEIDEDNYVPYGQVTIAMLEAHNGPVVLGDNRNDSNDSRYWINTYVTKDLLLAKAECIYYPFNQISLAL